MRYVFCVVFWIWAVIGFLQNGIWIIRLINQPPITIGDSAATMMLTLFWIGGLVTQGLGALMIRDNDRPTAVEPVMSSETRPIRPIFRDDGAR